MTYYFNRIVILWNVLPVTIRSVQAFSSFQNQLYKFLTNSSLVLIQIESKRGNLFAHMAVRLIALTGKIIYLKGHDVDVDVQGVPSAFHVTFTPQILTATDQMYYRIFVLANTFDTSAKYIFLRVLCEYF